MNMDKKYRKKLNAEFLEMKPLMGVLTILNNAENKIFIRESINLRALYNRIRFELNNGQFDNRNLQDDWIRLGEKSFVFENTIIVPWEENIIDYKKKLQKARNDLKEEQSKARNIY
ncbi:MULTISPECIES: GIY-YIG nuclease family protein [Sphingobacterium]|uniref:LuxR family transcriptional regulator n=1 Tax=Sphingobacterium athyrii TaxID=2152717 RepID=A0A363NWX7_9SPHI|nr:MULTISPECIES: GIY-YIG nuclease family protein [Sphingobacterium]PUV25295.1 LuxR family transcriptional regulator [Sphingobacterium athyrii]QIH34575.1 GIY-YIG nuclease family protein [Sphingobacterium sp. DR205]